MSVNQNVAFLLPARLEKEVRPRFSVRDCKPNYESTIILGKIVE